MKSKTLLIILLVVIVQSTFLAYFFTKYETSNNDLGQLQEEFIKYKKSRVEGVSDIINNPQKTELENIRNVTKQEKDVEDLAISGWIPDWDIPNGLSSIKSTTTSFNSISPVWFWVNEDGSLQETAYTNGPELTQYCKDNNIELIPTISLFDAEIMKSVLNDETKFNTHLEAILNQVQLNNYEGIDLDYESINLIDKEKYFDFIEQLSLELRKLDKKLVITVLSKWGDEVVYKTLPETRMTQDYKRIADLVDEFRIMTYEYTGRDNKEYGPIAPMAWMEDIVRYAIYDGVPRDKIMLGIHTYSYNYTNRSKMGSVDYYPVYNPQGDNSQEEALALFPSDVEEIINENDVNIEFNIEWGEAIGSYHSNISDTNRIIIFPTQESINLRKQLAADYGLRGVVYWRVGSEGNLEY